MSEQKTELLVPIVGMHFRPPAKQVLAVLPSGAKLGLEPEPENPYDEKAIKVFVCVADEVREAQYPALAAALVGVGQELDELIGRSEPMQLGYIADSDGKALRNSGGSGNREVGELMRLAAAAGEQVSATLEFDPSGMAFARVRAEPML